MKLTILNFAFKRPRKIPHRAANFFLREYGFPEWENADLVSFPANATEQMILNCGRSLGIQ